MPMQASTDRDLDSAGRRQHETGARWLLIGGVLFVLGLLLALVGASFPGVFLMSLATPPTLVGAALTVTSLVSRRSAAGKPFA
jgi:hypothetical protein